MTKYFNKNFFGVLSTYCFARIKNYFLCHSTTLCLYMQPIFQKKGNEGTAKKLWPTNTFSSHKKDSTWITMIWLFFYSNLISIYIKVRRDEVIFDICDLESWDFRIRPLKCVIWVYDNFGISPIENGYFWYYYKKITKIWTYV